MRTIIVALALSTVSVPGFAKTVDPLANYAALDFPRSGVPIGARWIQGTGPDGAATEGSNISHSSGLASMVLTSTLKRDMSFNLGRFLGLTAKKARNLNATYSALSVDRVADITRIEGLKPGGQILYEAIKAGKIEIKTDQSTGQTLKAAAEAKGIPIIGSAEAGNTATITLNGSDLYVAYRVMTVTTPTKNVVRSSFSNMASGFETEVGDFRVSRQQAGANCDSGTSPIPFQVINTATPDLSGSFPTKILNVSSGAVPQSFGWPVTQIGNQLQAVSLRISYAPSVRRFVQAGQHICFVDYPSDGNFVEVTTTVFTLQPLAKPSGL